MSDKYYIDGGCIMRGGGVVYESDDAFTPDQLIILCDLMNQPKHAGMDWETIQPYWEAECNQRGVDITPPWKLETDL